MSFDRGANWQELKNNLPRVPVFDIQIHPRDNDLILATHGRSVWILDSIAALEKLASSRDKAVDVFDVRNPVQWRLARLRDFDGHDHFVGSNPPLGAMIDFYVKAKPDAKDLKIRILDKAGKAVRTLAARNVEAGVNRLIWDLHYDRPVPLTPQEEEQITRAEASGGGGFGPQRSGPAVDPGEYSVEIALGNEKASTKIVVEEDPRIDWFSTADRSKRRAVIDELVDMTRKADTLRRKFTAVDTQLTTYQTAWKRPGSKPAESVNKAADNLKSKLNELRPLFTQRGPGGAAAAEGTSPGSPEDLAKPEPDFVLPALAQRIQGAIRDLESMSASPGKVQLQQVELVRQALGDATKSVDKLVNEDVAQLNKAMSAAQVPYIAVPPDR